MVKQNTEKINDLYTLLESNSSDKKSPSPHKGNLKERLQKENQKSKVSKFFDLKRKFKEEEEEETLKDFAVFGKTSHKKLKTLSSGLLEQNEDPLLNNNRDISSLHSFSPSKASSQAKVKNEPKDQKDESIAKDNSSPEYARTFDIIDLTSLNETSMNEETQEEKQPSTIEPQSSNFLLFPALIASNSQVHDEFKSVKLAPEQEEILKEILAGKNVFFTGSAGTGKTFLLRYAIKKLKEQTLDGIVAVTASTGVAAEQIQGTTLHKFSGVGVPSIERDFGKIWEKSSM